MVNADRYFTGAQAQIFIDLPEGTPALGEWLVTEGVRGVGSVYLIKSAREVRRRDPAAPRRLMLTVQRGYYVLDTLGQRVWRLRWYKRIATHRKLRPSALKGI
jgi:hypothetical protein